MLEGVYNSYRLSERQEMSGCRSQRGPKCRQLFQRKISFPRCSTEATAGTLKVFGSRARRDSHMFWRRMSSPYGQAKALSRESESIWCLKAGSMTGGFVLSGCRREREREDPNADNSSKERCNSLLTGYTRKQYDKHKLNGTTPHWGMRRTGFKYTGRWR